MKCLNCEKELEQIEGKREKQFCNSTCRSNYWQKAKRKIKQLTSKPIKLIGKYIDIEALSDIAIKKEETIQSAINPLDDMEAMFQEELRKIKNK